MTKFAIPLNALPNPFFFFQRDKALQQRQLASLDLFLESARQQLKLLMDKNMEEIDDKENS